MRHIKLIITLLYLQEVGLAITVSKLVYQKDMSEHCRRRVVPSIFLGRHVAEAHSHIMHFSRLDLPYSCFISVRAESGNSIILVIQLLSDDSLKSACAVSPNQLLVYEMGETFGGYWGPVPESVMNPTSPPVTSNVYTLIVEEPIKASSTPTVTENVTNDGDNIQYTSSVTTSEPLETENFFTLEVPIVNVSRALLVDSDDIPAKAFDVDETFDMFYNVTPGSDEEYDTSILPVVQFAIEKQPNSRRGGSEPQYQLQYDFGVFTPDMRLSFPQFSTITTPKKKLSRITNANKHFRKNKTARRTYARQTYFKKTSSKLSELQDFNKNSDLIKNFTESQLRDKTASVTEVQNWKEIEDLLLKVKGSSIIDSRKVTENTHIKELLKAISNHNYNYSVYLYPFDSFKDLINNNQANISNTIIGLFTTRITTRHIEKSIQTTNYNITSSLLLTTNTIDFASNTNEISIEDNNDTELITEAIINQNLTTIRVSKLNEHKMNENFTSNFTDFTKNSEETTVENIATVAGAPSTGSMVGRESWENVVQAAPVMAELLNQTVSLIIDRNITTISPSGSQLKEPIKRKKRELKSIPIEIARPHKMITRKRSGTTSERSFDISDMHDFVQLVELQDDEQHDRVALRYLGQYIGPTFFNICEHNETKNVFLFNSSRIVLALGNNTLERMTIIATPARTLITANSKCSTASLECQVYGTRVCVDTMNACDGVPNCGAYDVYDEDLLMCGGVVGVQHNVYLAAMTLIAVILTLLYAIHYWLKRCVPKVSEAFFIYTDDAENILYLETIMRSPFDVDSDTKAIYPGNLFYGTDVGYNDNKIKRLNVFSRVCKACCNFFTCKLKRNKYVSSVEVDTPKDNPEAKETYSFTEFELSKIGSKVDKEVQTGESLEMSKRNEEGNVEPAKFIKQNIEYSSTRRVTQSDIPGSTKDTVKKYIDELNILRVFKVSKSNPIESNSNESAFVGPEEKGSDEEEEEIKMHLYVIPDDDKGRKQKQKLKHESKTIASIYEDQPITNIKSESSNRLAKRLRFEEETVTIPNHEDEKNVPSTSGVIGRLHTSQKHTDNDELRPKTSRDFKRFWGGKNKKSKKKSQVLLH